MFKKFATVGMLVLTLSTCSTPASGHEIQKSKIETPSQNVFNTKPAYTLTIEGLARQTTILQNQNKLSIVVSKVRHYVNKTWYVFSGNTPSGWDCSGLTMWAYGQIGIDLEHRASIQAKTGIKTYKPMPGDIVAFSYKGYKSAYHVGIYMGNGLMIHAPEKGKRTKIESIVKFAGKWSNVQYRRILPVS